MATAAVSGFGTLFKRGDAGSPEAFTTIAEVRSINALNLTLEMLDATSHDTVGGYREWIPSFKDAGQASFEMNFIPTNPTQDPTTGMILDFDNRTRRNFQILFPDIGATTVTFAGYIMGFNITAAIDGILTASVTIRITGAPTWA